MKSKTKTQLDAWPTRKLREISEIRISNVDKKVYASEKPVKLCNYMDVYGNEYVTDRIQFMEGSATPAEVERFSLNSGDVIITKDSETPDDIGIPAVVLEQITNLVCGYHLALIRPNSEQLDSIYLAKQLSTSRVARYFSLHASGSTRYGLPVSAIEAVEVPTPPKAEQAKIAEILSTVDRAIEQTEALIAKQQRIKTGLMQDLLTRGIDENGNLRSEKTHQFKDSPLGRIPVEWEVQTTQVIAQKIWIGLVTTMTTNYVREGVKLIRNQNIKENRIQTEGVINLSLSFANLFSNRKLRVGDVVTVHTGDVGTSAVITNQFDGAHGFATINTRVDSGIIDNKYLCWFFNSQHFKRQITSVITGDGRDNLNLKDFVDLVVPFPRAISEQRLIAGIIGSCEERTINETNYLSKLRQQKIGLMQDLLTGKKRVTDLLNYEENEIL